MVTGTIEDFREQGADFKCGCLLAPEFPRSHKRKFFFCGNDCRTRISQRVYVDCSRREVLQYLIDFTRIREIPKAVLEYELEGGRIIREEEKRGSDVYPIVF